MKQDRRHNNGCNQGKEQAVTESGTVTHKAEHIINVRDTLILAPILMWQGRGAPRLEEFFNMDRPEHHSIDRLKERGVEKGSGRHSTLQGRERSVFNQTNIGTVSRATLGRLLRDEAERVWAFPSAMMPF